MAIDIDLMFSLIDEHEMSLNKEILSKIFADVGFCIKDRLNASQIDAINSAKDYWSDEIVREKRDSYRILYSKKIDQNLRDNTNENESGFIDRIIFCALLGNEGITYDTVGFFLEIANQLKVDDVCIDEIICRYIPEARGAIVDYDSQ